MESSSEDSFTWTDTSSDSIDSHSMAADESVLEKNIEINKHTKRKNVKQLSCEKYNSLQKDMVKVEPESDCDIRRKKKKNKHVEINGNENDLRDSTTYDESYLDLKVKQEEMAAPVSAYKIKKKRNLSESVDENHSETKKCRVKENSPDSYIGSLNIHFDTEIKTKKKKKKSKRKSESESQEEMQSSYNKDCEDIVGKEEVDSHSNLHTSRMEETSITESTFDNESCDEISAIQSDDHNIHTLSFHSGDNVENKSKGDSLYKTAIINQFKKDKNDEVQATEKRTPCLSDRIRFEDEDESEAEVHHANHNAGDKVSLKLKKFIKTTDNMKLISQELHHNSILTCDDEIWIIHCPKEIDVHGFCDADLNMNGKSKIKVGGQTYDGTLDNEECDTTAVLTMEHGKYEINNLPLSGIIKFRKRIPKAHFYDDNIMVNNQTNFIPLPETKCRHPLFGSNYKKALKIPNAIAQQLNSNGPEETLTTDRRKKKKHKKDKNTVKHEESDSKSEVRAKLEPELTLKETEKKKKKRKHTNDEGPASKRVKKLKHDPESAEAWESEKAIEQNLFSF